MLDEKEKNASLSYKKEACVCVCVCVCSQVFQKQKIRRRMPDTVQRISWWRNFISI